MTRAEFKSNVAVTALNRIGKLIETKGDEYAIKSAFHNFEQGVFASRTARTPIQALEGMQLKHTVSIRDILDEADESYLRAEQGFDRESTSFTKEQLFEKFCDSIVYDILKLGLALEILDLAKETRFIEKDDNHGL